MDAIVLEKERKELTEEGKNKKKVGAARPPLKLYQKP